MLHRAVMDVDPAVERRAQGKADGALHLLRHGIRVHHHAAVQGADHPVHARLPVYQGHLNRLRSNRAKRPVQRDALGMPGCQGPGPAELVRRELQNRRIAWRSLKQPHPEGQRILPGLKRQFVDEAFRKERVMRMPHRAPEAYRHTHAGGNVGHVLVGESVGQIKQPL